MTKASASFLEGEEHANDEGCTVVGATVVSATVPVGHNKEYITRQGQSYRPKGIRRKISSRYCLPMLEFHLVTYLCTI
jgi:hypothetical protein